MKKYNAVYLDDIENFLDLSIGTNLLIKGRTRANKNHSFTSGDINDWISDLEEKHFQHPVTSELLHLNSYINDHKIQLVLL